MKILQLQFFFLILNLFFSFCIFSSCTKESSCERCYVGAIEPPRDTTIVTDDTIKIDSTINFPFCNTCDSINPTNINSWSFINYNSYVCGTIDTSYFSLDNHSIQFWGRLNCSSDTGFGISAFFETESFNSNRSNISTKSLVFYVQDRTNYMDPWNGMILKYDLNPPFSMTLVIDTFIYATRFMSGRFYGYANAKNKKSYVEGKFNLTVP